MPTEPQLKPIAQALLQKTRKGEVNWIEDDSEKSDTAYVVKLPKASIVIKRVNPIAEPDYLILAFLDEKGHAALAWPVDEPEAGTPATATADWNLLLSLYSEARREATGWDKVLQEVETALASQGPIGQPAGSASTPRK